MKLPNRVYHYTSWYIAMLCFVLAVWNYEYSTYCVLIAVAGVFNFVAAVVHCNKDNINFLYKEIRKEKEDGVV